MSMTQLDFNLEEIDFVNLVANPIDIRSEHIVYLASGGVQSPVALALCDVATAYFDVANGDKYSFVSVTPKVACKLHRDGSLFQPSTLRQIHNFTEFIEKAKVEQDGRLLVICAGENPETITTCAQLIGSYLMLSCSASLEQITSIFSPLFSRFKDFRECNKTRTNYLNIFDCWQAISRASQLGWVDFTNRDYNGESALDMEEYHHYDNPANGYLHVIVPSKIIAFPSPRDMPPHLNRRWFDIDSQRYFSPSYFAELLSDFDASIVISTGSGVSYDHNGFLAAGLEFEDLSVSYAAPHRLLHASDRFLTLVRMSPGPVAVHGAGAGLGAAELLICSYLIKDHGFAARQAMAWVRMLHPGRQVPEHTFRVGVQPRPQQEHLAKPWHRSSYARSAPNMQCSAFAWAAPVPARACSAVGGSVAPLSEADGAGTPLGAPLSDDTNLNCVAAALARRTRSLPNMCGEVREAIVPV